MAIPAESFWRLRVMRTLATVYLLFVSTATDAKHIKGKIDDPLSDWIFITRFCFLSELGELQFRFNFPVQYQPVTFLLYYDTHWPQVYKTDKDGFGQLRILLYFDDQWPSVYHNNSKTCRQKESILNPENNQVIYLTEREGWSGCVQSDRDGEPWMQCDARKGFLSARERWWYVVASQCDGLKSCYEKTSPPYIYPSSGQSFVLMEDQYCDPLPMTNDGNVSALDCSHMTSFRTARERWWFLAVSRCYQEKLLHCFNIDEGSGALSPIAGHSLKGLSLDYEIWMTNGPVGDVFHREFSADEFYILEVDIAFLLAISVLLVLSIVVAVVLRNRRMLHTTFKLYIVSLVFEFLHLLVMCISYGKYANDGLDNYPSKTFGRVLEAVSVLVFLLMLILMAKGFTITRGRISVAGSVKIAIFMTIYVITYAILFIYEAAWFDPGLVLYLYESPAGYGLLALRLIAWVWFCYATFFTLKHFPEKRKFYYPFFIFYTFWFWAGPVAVLVSNLRMAPWTREKIANGVFCAINFCCEAILLFLTRPSNANKNFPYHIRTTQVGDMGVDDGSAPAPNQFGYMPALEDSGSGPSFSALFTVSTGRQTQYAIKTTEFLRPPVEGSDDQNNDSTFKNGNFFVTSQTPRSS